MEGQELDEPGVGGDDDGGDVGGAAVDRRRPAARLQAWEGDQAQAVDLQVADRLASPLALGAGSS